MISDRLPLALDAVTLAGDGRIAVLNPAVGADLSTLPKARVVVVSPLATVCCAFDQAGYSVMPEMAGEERFAASIICLPRARDEARALIARSMAQTDGLVIVDGASLGFLRGSTVDYTQDMMRAGFEVLNNPNSETGCGCGVSFAPKDA